jgi:hypothetical protein
MAVLSQPSSKPSIFEQKNSLLNGNEFCEPHIPALKTNASLMALRTKPPEHHFNPMPALKANGLPSYSPGMPSFSERFPGYHGI